MRRVSLSRISDERLLRLRLKDLGLTISGTWLEGCVRKLYYELDSRGLRLQAACMDFRRLVFPGRHSRFRDSVLPRSPTAAPPGADAVSRRGRRVPRRVHAHHASRNRTRVSARVPAASSAGGGSSCSGSRPPAIPSTIVPIRPASATCSTCGCGTRRAIRTRTSPRHSRSGCVRARTGDGVMRGGRR